MSYNVEKSKCNCATLTSQCFQNNRAEKCIIIKRNYKALNYFTYLIYLHGISSIYRDLILFLSNEK